MPRLTAALDICKSPRLLRAIVLRPGNENLRNGPPQLDAGDIVHRVVNSRPNSRLPGLLAKFGSCLHVICSFRFRPEPELGLGLFRGRVRAPHGMHVAAKAVLSTKVKEFRACFVSQSLRP